MRKPIPIPGNRVAELEAFKKAKWPGLELQRYLCVWLRVAKNMTAPCIAEIVGWGVNTVRLTQKRFIERGVDALEEHPRGGRHHANMSPAEEAEFLAKFEKKAADGGLLIAQEIKDALEERVGHKVNKTTVYRLLHRNGWRKVAPRPAHPKRDKEAGEAFKKGASPND
jgi:transposase